MVQNMTCTFWLSKMAQITHWGSGLVERQCQVQLDSLFDIFFSMEETTIGSGKKDEGDEDNFVQTQACDPSLEIIWSQDKEKIFLCLF